MTRSLYRHLRLCLIAVLICQPALASDSLNLVSINMNRLFDDKDDGLQEKVVSHRIYQKRIRLLIRKIITDFNRPDILALQEVENIDILYDIAEHLKDNGLHYQAILKEGNDVSGIDVGFLVNKRYRVTQQEQLFVNRRIGNSDHFLFSRPPLLIEVCRTQCATIINLHLRSMRKLSSKQSGTRVARKRMLQAESMAQWIDSFQASFPHKRLLITGDFNALPKSDEFVDVVGIIKGQPDQRRPKRKSQDLIARDLLDLTQAIPSKQRYSYIYRKRKQQLDYLLISEVDSFKLDHIRFHRIDYKLSDHAPLNARITLLSR